VELAVEQLDLEDVVLVMNDVGGAIGTGAAVRRPRRYRGLVAIDALGFPLTDFTYIRGMLALMRIPGARAVAARLDLLGLVLRLGGQGIADDADPAEVFASMEDLAGRRRSLDLLADLGADTAFLDEIEGGLTRLRSRPVLAAFGQFDPARLAGFQGRWARFFPDTTPVVIPGGRHFSHEDAPRACAAALAHWYDARVAA
jgi:haloalkane dehalogenase